MNEPLFDFYTNLYKSINWKLIRKGNSWTGNCIKINVSFADDENSPSNNDEIDIMWHGVILLNYKQFLKYFFIEKTWENSWLTSDVTVRFYQNIQRIYWLPLITEKEIQNHILLSIAALPDQIQFGNCKLTLWSEFRSLTEFKYTDRLECTFQ